MLLEGKLVFVMGGGKFGTKAIKYLVANGAKVLVVDSNPKCRTLSDVDFEASDLCVVDSLEAGQSTFLVGDAVEHLLVLLETKVPDYVVTEIPGDDIAVAIKKWFLRCCCTFEPYQEIFSDVLSKLPRSLVTYANEDSAMIVVSYMSSNIQCRDDCMLPKDFCPKTDRPKLAPMDKLLEFAFHNQTDASQILQSKQLTSRLLVINGKELYSFLKLLETCQTPFTLAIGIVCECHCVISLAKIAKQPK